MYNIIQWSNIPVNKMTSLRRRRLRIEPDECEETIEPESLSEPDSESVTEFVTERQLGLESGGVKSITSYTMFSQ